MCAACTPQATTIASRCKWKEHASVGRDTCIGGGLVTGKAYEWLTALIALSLFCSWMRTCDGYKPAELDGLYVCVSPYVRACVRVAWVMPDICNDVSRVRAAH